jgi:prophage antirepressor-like protein
MRNLLIFLFGRRAESVVTVNIDGVEWYPAQSICQWLGIKDVSSAMRDRVAVMELFDEADKCKRRVPELNRHSDVWLLSMSGIWKLMLCSKSIRADMFRTWLAMEFLPISMRFIEQQPGLAVAGYSMLFYLTE